MQTESKSAPAIAAPVYTVKNVKTFRGREGQGFNATLYLGARKIAEVDDDANGGVYSFHWLEKDREKARADEAALEAHVKTVAPIMFNGEPMVMDADLFVSELVDDYNIRKSLVSLLKASVVLLVGGQLRNTKRGTGSSPAVIASVKARHPDAQILNEMEFEQAFAIFRSKAS